MSRMDRGGAVKCLKLTERRAKMATLNAPDQPEDNILAVCGSQRRYRMRERWLGRRRLLRTRRETP